MSPIAAEFPVVDRVFIKLMEELGSWPSVSLGKVLADRADFVLSGSIYEIVLTVQWDGRIILNWNSSRAGAGFIANAHDFSFGISPIRSAKEDCPSDKIREFKAKLDELIEFVVAMDTEVFRMALFTAYMTDMRNKE